MKVKANYQRGTQYFYAPRATLAILHLTGGLFGSSQYIPLYLKPPSGQPRSEYHRVSLVVIRTKPEAAALTLKYARLRKLRRAQAKNEALNAPTAGAK